MRLERVMIPTPTRLSCEPFMILGGEIAVADYRSYRRDGMSFAVGAMAAALAVVECVCVIVLVNRVTFRRVFDVSEWAVPWVTSGAVIVIVFVVASVIIGATPRESR